MHVASRPDFCSVELEGQSAHVYNETAFRYLLSVERRRADRTNRGFAILLISRGGASNGAQGLDGPTAAQIFSQLSRSLRDTDFLGWYVDGAVVGAVLTHLGERSEAEIKQQVHSRVNRVLGEFLADAVGLEVRLFHLPAQQQELSEYRS